MKADRLWLARCEISPSEDPDTIDPHRFLRIGELPYDEEAFELAVKPSEESIYILGDETVTPDLKRVPVDDPESTYPSVYHLLLDIDLRRSI